MKRPKQELNEHPSSLLVSTFFRSANAAFQPLVSEPTAQWVCRVRQLTRRGLELTTPEEVQGFFLAGCEFRLTDIAGEITYGDREVFINATARATSHAERYGLWEWAGAIGLPDLVPRATDIVVQLDRIEDIVNQMARAKVRATVPRSPPA